MNQQSRRHKLEEFLASHPHDAFARFGLALECANSGDDQTARSHFQTLLENHDDYVPGYYHYGQLLLRTGHTEEARRVLSDGIVVAQKAGNTHAMDEMRAALESIPKGTAG